LKNSKNIKIGKNSCIDKTSIIGYISPRIKKNAKLFIGDNATIRSNCVIYLGSKIGNNFETGHNVVIREENVIGDNVKIWNNTVVDYGCRIGNNVKIHSNCYIAQYTTIEDDVFIAPGTIIANDPHPGCKFYKECMRGPTIKKGVKIGCNVTLLPFITIGENSLIGAGSVVTKDIPPNSVAYGNPAKVYKKIWELKCTTGITKKPYPKIK
jgi:acetyltransferase-like isoleucine patch superfamily enzyme